MDKARRRTDRRGFTLIEILLVILIIGMLLGIALPSMLRARTSGAAKTWREPARHRDGERALRNGE